MTSMEHAPLPLPLAGVKVMDLTWAVAGPLIGKYLAMFGATVIKVESRKRPDSSRMSGPFRDGRHGMNRAGGFTTLNASKQSIGLRLDLPESRPVIDRLVGWADLVIENYTPGVIERMGLDYASLEAINPRVILVSTSMQGRSGPRATHPGFGASLQALSGLDFMSGFPDGDFGAPTAVLPDYFGPWLALTSILEALEDREETGHGARLEVSQFEAALEVLAPALIASSRGEPQFRNGNRSASACPQGIFPAAGGRWIALSVTGDPEWQSCCGVLGLPALGADVALRTEHGRRAREAELEAAIGAATEPHDADALATALQEAGVAAYPVASGLDVVNDPQLAARGHWTMVQHPVVGEVPVDGPSYLLDGLRPHIEPGPLYGAQTRSVLTEYLGFSEEQLEAFAAAGAVQFE